MAHSSLHSPPSYRSISGRLSACEYITSISVSPFYCWRDLYPLTLLLCADSIAFCALYANNVWHGQNFPWLSQELFYENGTQACSPTPQALCHSFISSTLCHKVRPTLDSRRELSARQGRSRCSGASAVIVHYPSSTALYSLSDITRASRGSRAHKSSPRSGQIFPSGRRSHMSCSGMDET